MTYVKPCVRDALAVDKCGLHLKDDPRLLKGDDWWVYVQQKTKRTGKRTILAHSNNPLLNLPAGTTNSGEGLEDLDGLAPMDLKVTCAC